MKRTNKATVYFVMTGVALLGGSGVSYMLFQGNSDKESTIAKLRQDARDPAKLQAELDAVSEEATATATKLAHLEKGIPELAYVPTMLKELEAFGNKNGISVTGVRPVPRAPKDPKKKERPKPYEELTIEIKGRGKYRAVMDFVAALKAFPKIVTARAVSMTPKNDGMARMAGAPPSLDVTIELRAYLFKPTKEELSSLIGEPEPVKDSDSKPSSTEKAPAGTTPTARTEGTHEG